MKRKLILEGDLGRKFGKERVVTAKSVADAFKVLAANNPEFREYMLQQAADSVVYSCKVGNDLQGNDDFMLPTGSGDIVVTPIPGGSSSGGEKILAAIAIAVVTYFTFGAGGALGGSLGLSSATSATIANIGYAVAANLALSGIQQMLAPDPATDDASPQSYLFNGAEQNLIEGDPVPVLYGQLRVPGQPISIEISNGEFNT